jgi:predicted DCC family thiol-disulfide oxidoreductase YuxK
VPPLPLIVPTPPAANAPDAPVVLYDGTCGLCDKSVSWILRRDPRGVFRFAALTSAAARSLLADRNTDPASLPDSVVLVEGPRVLTRSDAVLAIASRLGFPWSLAAAGRVVPRVVRDGLYAWAARRRYRWFGNACRVPTPGERARFLDADEHAAKSPTGPVAERQTQRT